MSGEGQPSAPRAFSATGRKPGFDTECDLAALVYEEHQDPDAVLREFAAAAKPSFHCEREIRPKQNFPQ